LASQRTFEQISFGHPANKSYPLKVEDKVPDVTLPGSDGKLYKLSDVAGKQAIVIAWYPKAFTAG